MWKIHYFINFIWLIQRPQYVKLNIVKLFKRLILFVLVISVVYLNYLHTQIKKEFLESLNSSNSGLSLEKYPKALVDLLLVVEDQSFFQHFGVDFVEISKVLYDYWINGKPIRGASTLTQQLVKNTFLTHRKTFKRKSKEILMALLLELTFDKKTILNHYMNNVYLGQKGYYVISGFENGAWFYFNKTIRKLSLEELATLVALVKGPSYYNPVKHPERLARRTRLILYLYYRDKGNLPQQ